MMTPFECYLTYRAIKAHFNTQTYDYFKNEGRIKAKVRHMTRRHDKAFFEYLANTYKNHEIVELLVANVVHHEDFWIGELANKEASKIYNKWTGRYESITYLMLKTLKLVQEHTGKDDHRLALKESIKTSKKAYPVLFRLMTWRQVPIECFVLLELYIGFFDKWDKEIEDKLIWPSFRVKCDKYKPFLIKFMGKEKIRQVAHIVASNGVAKYGYGDRLRNSSGDSTGTVQEL